MAQVRLNVPSDYRGAFLSWAGILGRMRVLIQRGSLRVMIDLAAAQQVLKTTFGYDEFRPGQKAVIEQVLAGENTLSLIHI